MLSGEGFQAGDKAEHIPAATVAHRSVLDPVEHKAEPLVLHMSIVGTGPRHIDEAEGRVEGFADCYHTRRGGRVDSCDKTFRDECQWVQLKCE